MNFHNEIVVHPLKDGINWITRDWTAVYLIGLGLVFVPKGFKTDFGSIMQIMWALVGAPATGLHRRGVFYHDWLYTSQQCSRKQADDICLEIMKEDGTGFIKRQTIYAGVRIGGWVAWNRKSEQVIEMYRTKQKEQLKETALQCAHTMPLFA